MLYKHCQNIIWTREDLSSIRVRPRSIMFGRQVPRAHARRTENEFVFRIKHSGIGRAKGEKKITRRSPTACIIIETSTHAGFWQSVFSTNCIAMMYVPCIIILYIIINNRKISYRVRFTEHVHTHFFSFGVMRLFKFCRFSKFLNIPT